MDWEATGVGGLGPRSGRSRASVPSGASTGATEAKELRDGEPRFKGAGCLQAVANAEGALAEAVVGLDPRDQAAVDAALCRAAPGDKAGLGANAVCALSMACCKAGAAADELPLFRHVNRLAAKVLGAPVPMCMPVPCLNVVNGGVHASNLLAFQEFFLIPLGAATFRDVSD